MFKGIGANIIHGAIEKIGKSGTIIGMAIKDCAQDIKKVPGLNLPPLLLQIGSEIPEYWDGLPREQKQALFNALIAAGAKAAMTYAKS